MSETDQIDEINDGILVPAGNGQVRKTMIGVLTSRDEEDPGGRNKNTALVALFNQFYSDLTVRDKLKRFAFVFTGGTYDRVILGSARDSGVMPVDSRTKDWLEGECGVIRLPTGQEGGVTVLGYLVAQHVVSILWIFLSPLTMHWLRPENLALLRLCDHLHAKTLLNSGSVEEWVATEAGRDANRNQRNWPLGLIRLEGSEIDIPIRQVRTQYYKMETPQEMCADLEFPDLSDAQSRSETIIALIAHDDMKPKMADFASDYEEELLHFGRILTTGTTGKLVGDSALRLGRYRKKNGGDYVFRYRSGPKGGDIEIATEVLYGNCHVVIFFVDPLHPHPHIDDIRVVFGACMRQDKVRMLSHEIQAREWMDRVVRGM